MLNKRMLLASSALAVIASVSQAQADGDFYVSVHGGANWLANDHAGRTVTSFTTSAFNQDSDAGFVLGGAVGLHLDRWLNGLRAELGIDYRRNDVNGAWFASTFSGTDFGVLSANASKFSVMANVWYDIDVGRKWTPYLGGGVGWARTRAEGAFVVTATSAGGASNVGGTTFSRQESGFAWQLGAGLNYEIQDGVRLGLGYRYFQGPEIDNNIFFGKNNLPVNFDHDNHSVQLELAIDID